MNGFRSSAMHGSFEDITVPFKLTIRPLQELLRRVAALGRPRENIRAPPEITGRHT